MDGIDAVIRDGSWGCGWERGQGGGGGGSGGAGGWIGGQKEDREGVVD